MTKDVKAKDATPRTYRSTLRADQARETRRRVREAADALFLERGYVATSMNDIAAAAGVSRQTVFSAFGSKAGLLKEAFDVRLAGDDEPVAIAQRPEAQQILEQTEPRALMHAHADFYIVTTLRVLPLWPAMVAGAATDDACAEVLAFFDRGRFEGPGEIVDVLGERGWLRTGLTRRKGKEAMYLLTNPMVTHDARRSAAGRSTSSSAGSQTASAPCFWSRASAARRLRFLPIGAPSARAGTASRPGPTASGDGAELLQLDDAIPVVAELEEHLLRVLPELGSGGSRCPWRAPEVDRRRHHLERVGTVDRHGHEPARRPCLRVVHHLVGVLDGSPPHVLGVEQRSPTRTAAWWRTPR